MLQDVLKKSSEAWAASHAAHHLIDAYRISAAGPVEYSAYNAPASFIRHTSGMIRSLHQRLRELVQVRVCYGSQRLYILLRREGWPDNHKRVHRLYCLEGLNLRNKRFAAPNSWP